MDMQLSKPWLAHYPDSVPATIDASAYPTLVDLLDEAFRTYSERTAAVCMGSRLRFKDIDGHADALGAWLQSRGLPVGARVALMMPNLPQYMVAIPAVLRAGFVVVNVNPLYTARELEHQLKDSGAEAIVVLENFAHVLQEVLPRTAVRHIVVASVGDLLGFWKGRWLSFAVRHLKKAVPSFALQVNGGSVVRFNDAIASGQAMRLVKPAIGPDSIAFLQYTGGTTGLSKGAMLLHRNVVANVLQTEAWFAPMLRKLGPVPLTCVCALPLYHIFALTICHLMGARLGMNNLLIPNPRDIRGLVRTLAKHQINMFPAVNTLFNALTHDAEFARLDFSKLVISNGGGMAVQAATARRWREMTGCPVVEGYGLSETSPVVTSNRLDIDEFSGTIGLPIPSTDVVLRDDDGEDVPLGGTGEICIRGPQVMPGYWNRPDETAHVMTADGYFRSGDMGVMEATGHLRIVDRKKDMILVSGFNVYPTEIEQVVNQHPGVLECAAIGVPDEKSGEAVKLYVVKAEPALTEEDLVSYGRSNFTSYKRPKYIEFRDELPKSNVGKILRRELRGTVAT